jgi:hypothetical protein
MPSKQNIERAKSTSMDQADTANGEAPDAGSEGQKRSPYPRFDSQASQHRTGKRQADENKEDDPPA